MDALNFARWQFGITTAYHFLFVPLSIGLVFLVAVMQTLWIRTRDHDCVGFAGLAERAATAPYIVWLALLAIYAVRLTRTQPAIQSRSEVV